MSLSMHFLTHFCPIVDPRKDNHNKRHLLGDILVLTILAVLCGADSWTEVEAFGKAKREWLNTFLALPNGIPSHDTLGSLFARINPEQLQACFISWVKSLVKTSAGEIIPIDGKTLKRSQREGRRAIHMVSAWASANGSVLGQLKTAEKSNEIKAIPELLGMLDIKGCIVTIDAMGCQKEIASTIIDKEADYVLSLKENHPTLNKEVRLFLELARTATVPGLTLDYYDSVEKGHGRKDIRRYWVSEQLEWLTSRGEWKQLRSVGMVESERHVGDKVSIERRFYLTSLPAQASLFAHAVRTHWSIENQLHWSLDVAFREDECRVRKGHAAENFAVLRHIALTMLNQEKTAKVGLKIKRSKAGWDNNYLAKILCAAGF